MNVSRRYFWISALALAFSTGFSEKSARADEVPPTREFEIRNDRPWLGGHEVDLWGLRCGNALHSDAVTERHINNFDNMVAHGINLIGVYIQGSNGGWPNPEAGLNGLTRDGKIKPPVAARLERLIREADRRGMVVMVGIISPRKDQDLYNEAAIRNGIENTARFLQEKKLRNVFVDLMHEFSHPERADHELLREPQGEEKKARLATWFKAIAPEIEVGVCPDHDAETGTTFPGMDVLIIQKDMPVPDQGFVINVEVLRQDDYQNDGLFKPGSVEYIVKDCEQYLAKPHAVMLFHAAYLQGIGNFSGTAPHPEMGGYGKKPEDRGIRFYYDWVRNNVGRWEYPHHIAGKMDSRKK